MNPKQKQYTILNMVLDESRHLKKSLRNLKNVSRGIEKDSQIEKIIQERIKSFEKTQEDIKELHEYLSKHVGIKNDKVLQTSRELLVLEKPGTFEHWKARAICEFFNTMEN